jgi:hypothetical protein
VSNDRKKAEQDRLHHQELRIIGIRAEPVPEIGMVLEVR